MANITFAKWYQLIKNISAKHAMILRKPGSNFQTSVPQDGIPGIVPSILHKATMEPSYYFIGGSLGQILKNLEEA